jgi:hypothetical protein
MSNTTTRQTIGTARRLAKQADMSENQAMAYALIATTIRGLSSIDEETRRIEAARYDETTEEFYADADDLRGQVDPELIDFL